MRDADKEALKRAEKMRLEEQKALEALMKEPEEGELQHTVKFLYSLLCKLCGVDNRLYSSWLYNSVK